MIRQLLWLCLLLAACTPPSASNSPLPTPYRRYLPYVVAAPPPTPTAQPRPPTCWPTIAALTFFELLARDGRQQRPRLQCDPRLVAAAQRRAAAQPPTGLSHCDAAGVCANQYARAAGCRLPANYGHNGNNIESLTAGTVNPIEAFASLARSPSHAVHLFGQNDFFRAQDRIGIAVAEIPGYRWRWAWSVLIARCE